MTEPSSDAQIHGNRPDRSTGGKKTATYRRPSGDFWIVARYPAQQPENRRGGFGGSARKYRNPSCASRASATLVGTRSDRISATRFGSGVRSCRQPQTNPIPADALAAPRHTAVIPIGCPAARWVWQSVRSMPAPDPLPHGPLGVNTKCLPARTTTLARLKAAGR
jgi:hypothetical protein